MRFILRTTLAVGIALACVCPDIAFANDTALGSIGGSVAPRQETDVRMQAETIQCTVYGRFAEYRVDFEFVNESNAPKTVLLGFPFLLPNLETPGYMPEAGFRAWHEGRELDVGYAKAEDDPERPLAYYTHEVTFAPGANRVTVSYLASPNMTSATTPEETPPAPWQDVEQHSQRSLTYWVHTGAGWAGTIGRTLIRYRFSPDAPAWGAAGWLERQALYFRSDAKSQGRPEYETAARIIESVRQPDPFTFEWEYVDYEPVPDIGAVASSYDRWLTFYQPIPGSEYSIHPASSAKGSSELQLGEYTYPAHHAVDGLVSTAWAENADGDGSGESIALEYVEPQQVAEVRVVSGYAKRPELFAKYNRPRALRITFDDGSSEVLELEDHPGLQRFAIAPRQVSSARIEIAGVYRGTTRNETYLSEVQFGSVAAPEFEAFETLMDRTIQAYSPDATSSAEVTVTPAGAPLTPPEPSGTDDDGAAPSTPGAWTLLALALVTMVAWLVTRKNPGVNPGSDDVTQPETGEPLPQS